MRLVDLEKHKAIRKRLSFNNALFVGAPTFIILFFLSLGAGFGAALLLAILLGGGVFGLIYFIRELTHKSVERRRKKLDINNPVIDVLFRGEIGLIEFTDNSLIYHTLTPGGANKDFEVPLTEDMFVSAGDIKYTKLQQIRHRDIKSGYIMTKQMPNGLPRQFIFYNTDDVLKKVLEILDRINKFYPKQEE